jgi:hypothetical protein
VDEERRRKLAMEDAESETLETLEAGAEILEAVSQRLENPFIFRVLDVSTGHISLSDVDGLENSGRPVYELEGFGWLVYVGELEDNWPSDVFSGAFINILRKAQELECDYVRFDRDGREYPELQTFDW